MQLVRKYQYLQQPNQNEQCYTTSWLVVFTFADIAALPPEIVPPKTEVIFITFPPSGTATLTVEEQLIHRLNDSLKNNRLKFSFFTPLSFRL
jgi:hypothetical protein